MQIDSEFISAIGVLIIGIFQIYQYRINKMTDYKISHMKEEDKKRAKVENQNIGQIYGMLWGLTQFGFDRVYIVRPHPKKHHEMISVQMEIKKNGVSSIKDNFCNVAMADIPHLTGKLSEASTPYFVIKNVNDDDVVQDALAKSIFNSNGTTCGAFCRLEDKNGEWNGNIFCTKLSSDNIDLDDEKIKKAIVEVSWKIQLILPDYD